MCRCRAFVMVNLPEISVSSQFELFCVPSVMVDGDAFVSMFHGQVVAKISCAGRQFRPLKCRQGRGTAYKTCKWGAEPIWHERPVRQQQKGKAQSFARAFSGPCQMPGQPLGVKRHGSFAGLLAPDTFFAVVHP